MILNFRPKILSKKVLQSYKLFEFWTFLDENLIAIMSYVKKCITSNIT